eukprot:TRINITY_DN8287_c0_g1_i1.p1 TRINITY_DN8287_c0_g1~~TRINITY_DN8287_c0_g1_i1.p1  ORF type:complete len:692 (-),score=117.72 TRINITY_DN8287_c0_g1_i1:31-2106(-)
MTSLKKTGLKQGMVDLSRYSILGFSKPSASSKKNSSLPTPPVDQDDLISDVSDAEDDNNQLTDDDEDSDMEGSPKKASERTSKRKLKIKERERAREDRAKEREEASIEQARAKVQDKGSLSKTKWDELMSNATQPTISVLLHRALTKTLGFNRLTKVQAQTIPLLLQGKNVMVQSSTGSGKTLAYLVPAIEMIMRSVKGGRGLPIGHTLILCPTRELVLQIETVARQLLKRMPIIKCHAVYGGTSTGRTLSGLRGVGRSGAPSIIIATPGRLLAHIEETDASKFMLCNVQLLVLDEADSMLESGFHKDIMAILGVVDSLGQSRQTALFSASIDNKTRKLKESIMNRRCSFISVGPVAKRYITKQMLRICKNTKDMMRCLASMLVQSSEARLKVVVFLPTIIQTEMVSLFLDALGIPNSAISGGLKQSKRNKILDAFRAPGTGGILCCTDVIARGVDIPDIDFIIQCGPPSSNTNYIHRIGRTNRTGGSVGKTALLLTKHEKAVEPILVKAGAVFESVPEDMCHELSDTQEGGIKNPTTLLEENVRFIKVRDSIFFTILRFYNYRKLLKLHNVMKLVRDYSTYFGVCPEEITMKQLEPFSKSERSPILKAWSVVNDHKPPVQDKSTKGKGKTEAEKKSESGGTGSNIPDQAKKKKRTSSHIPSPATPSDKGEKRKRDDAIAKHSGKKQNVSK